MRRWLILGTVLAVSLAAPLLPVPAPLAPAASAATFPGQNGPIAFSRDVSEPGVGDIWITSPDGSSMTQLTDDPADDGSPAISPDGTHIAFASDRSGTYQVYVMGIDGSGVVALTTTGGLTPSWSPDGTRIVYVGNGGLWVMDADGTDPVQITDDPASELYPTWSPDGTRIAYGRDDSGTPSIHVVDADGTDDALVTTEVDGLESSWSPDGILLAFGCDGVAGQGLCTIHPDGSGLTQLTNADLVGGVDQAPSWSPDGSTIVFRRERTGDGGLLYVIHADGTGLAAITSPSQGVGDWSPSWGSGWSSRTEITTTAPDPPITGLPYSVVGTVTVDPAWGHPNEALPGDVVVSDEVHSCDAKALPTADAGVYAFTCRLTAGDPGGVAFTARYSAEPRWAIMPSSGVGASVIVAVPGPPTGAAASVPGPGATWTWVSATPPADGPTPTGYQARCVPVGVAFDTSPNVNPAVVFTGGPTLPVTVRRLVRGTTYHCMVRARYGPDYATEGGDAYEGPLSRWSNAFTVPVIAPPPPTGVVASTPISAAPRRTMVSWTKVVNDTGAPVTFSVRCVSSNGGVTQTASASSSPVRVASLTRGKKYVCQVRATNAKGSSAWTSSNQIATP